MLKHDVISFVSEIEKNDPFSKACEIGLFWKIQSDSKTKFEIPLIHDFISRASKPIHARWIKGWSEAYPEHYEAHKVFNAVSKGDKAAFYDFIRTLFPNKDPGRYVGHVWEVMYNMWLYYPWPYGCHLLKRPRGYVRTSVKNERRAEYYRKDSFKAKKKDELHKDLIKLKPDVDPEDLKEDLKPLFMDIFCPFDGYADNIVLNDFEDLKHIKNIIAIQQAYNAMKDIPPERIAHLVDLFVARYLFNIPRYLAGTLLGWPEDRVQRVWRFLNLHKDHIQKLIPKKVIDS